jgi:RNase P subunit RPR2
MFLIDEHGERPICKDCRKPFAATAKQIAAIRRQWPEVVVICRPCYRRRRARFAPRKHAV